MQDISGEPEENHKKYFQDNIHVVSDLPALVNCDVFFVSNGCIRVLLLPQLYCER
jgi:hypothetical protein